MRPLPTVGGDTDAWGTILNAYLQELVPAGTIVQYAGTSAPAGWLMCDGTSQLRATYNDLFTALGGASSPWGLPDGTHFNVPDLQGRIPVGKGSHSDVDTLAKNDGATLSDRRPKHKHTATATDSGHSHSLIPNSTSSGSVLSDTGPYGSVRGPDGGGSYQPNTSAASAVITSVVGPQTNAPTDGPAYVVVNYIIKT